MVKRILYGSIIALLFLVGCLNSNRSCTGVSSEIEIIQKTNNNYDLYIVGDGYFQLENDENALVYCKGGRVEFNGANLLCFRKGGKLLKFSPPIQAPTETKQLIFSIDGEVRAVEYSDPNYLTVIGQFQIFSIREPIFGTEGDVIIDWGAGGAPREVSRETNESVILSSWSRCVK